MSTPDPAGNSPNDSVADSLPPAASAAGIFPAWLGVLLATWLGTLCGGMLFGLLAGAMPFLILGPIAAITGLYGAILGLFLTIIISLPVSVICTGLVRLLSPQLRNRRNYSIAAVISGFLSGVICFSSVWELQPIALLPGCIGAVTAGIAVFLTARNSIISAPAPPPVSSWGDLDQ